MLDSIDSVLQAFGFQDLKQAHDWIIQNGPGRVIAVTPSPPSPSCAPHTTRISDLEQQVKLLQLELDKKTNSNKHLRGFLADTNVRIEELDERKPGTSFAFHSCGDDEQQTRPSLMEELKRTRADAETAKVELDRLQAEVMTLRCRTTSSPSANVSIIPLHPQAQFAPANLTLPTDLPHKSPTVSLPSTATSYGALQVQYAHLCSKYNTLTQTMAEERATFEDERKRWRRFKRRYAARLLASGPSNPADESSKAVESSRHTTKSQTKLLALQLELMSSKFKPPNLHAKTYHDDHASGGHRNPTSPLALQDLNQHRDPIQSISGGLAECRRSHLNVPSKRKLDVTRGAEPAFPSIAPEATSNLVDKPAAPYSINSSLTFVDPPNLSHQQQRSSSNSTVRLSSVASRPLVAVEFPPRLGQETDILCALGSHPPHGIPGASLTNLNSTSNECPSRARGDLEQSISAHLQTPQRQKVSGDRISPASSPVVQSIQSQDRRLPDQLGSGSRRHASSRAIPQDQDERTDNQAYANYSGVQPNEALLVKASSQPNVVQPQVAQTSHLESKAMSHQMSPGFEPLNLVIDRLKDTNLPLMENQLPKSASPILSKPAPVNNTTPSSVLPGKKWIRYSDRQARAERSVWQDLDNDSLSVFTSKGSTSTSLIRKISEQVDWADVQDRRPTCKSSNEAGPPQKAMAAPPRLGDVPSMSGTQQNPSTMPKFDDPSTSPKLSHKKTSRDSMCPSPKDQVLTSISKPKYPFVCRELGLPPTPYTSRSVFLSSPISPARLDRAKMCADTTPDHERETKRAKKGGQETFSTVKKKTRQKSHRRRSAQKTPLAEEFPGQNFMREIHRKRKEDMQKSNRKALQDQKDGDSKVSTTDASSRGLMSRFEINPESNFGVRHLFNEVARGKEVRQKMHGGDCKCCAGYYEQVAKDFNEPFKDVQKQITKHKNEISRHRHFNPPPATPPYYWQMGFPDTQQVEIINREADEKKRQKLELMEAQARDGIGPYKFRNDHASGSR